MIFSGEKAIYLQIADIIYEQIITGNLENDNKIPSVREYAVLVEVNQNTILKTYSLLETQGVIYKKRGIGYFISPDGKKLVLKMKKKHFLENDVPGFVKTMKLLDINLEEFSRLYNKITNIKNAISKN
jgi:GntR family transcriptional regulator